MENFCPSSWCDETESDFKARILKLFVTAGLRPNQANQRAGSSPGFRLSKVAGSNYASCTRRIAMRFLTDQLGRKVLWEGRKGKLTFRNLHLVECIINAVRSCHKCEDFKVETIVRHACLTSVISKGTFCTTGESDVNCFK
ncbi:uncharacterized protein ISCGN_009164 [Ixodes scapularis]